MTDQSPLSVYSNFLQFSKKLGKLIMHTIARNDLTNFWFLLQLYTTAEHTVSSLFSFTITFYNFQNKWENWLCKLLLPIIWRLSILQLLPRSTRYHRCLRCDRSRVVQQCQTVASGNWSICVRNRQQVAGGQQMWSDHKKGRRLCNCKGMTP